MKTRNFVMGVVASLLVASVGYVYVTARNATQDNLDGKTVRIDADATPAPHVPIDGREIATKPLPPTELSRPTALLDRYVESIDLLALAGKLRADADSGNAEAARIIAMIYKECAQVAARDQRLVDDKDARDSFDDEEQSILRIHNAKMQQRCSGFKGSGSISTAAVEATETRVAELNDLAAQGRRLADEVGARRQDDEMNDALSDAEIELSRNIARSGDAEAISTLAGSQDDRFLGKRAGQAPSSLPTNQLAWELVACDLGRDCGSNGYIMRNLCISMDQCIGGTYRDYLRRRLIAPDKYQAVLAREREILQAIKSGDVSTVIP